MLDVLGLDDHEELTYRHLLELPSGSPDDVVGVTGLDRLDASRILGALESKGLVARSTADRERYVASPPSLALGALLIQRQEELRRAQVEMTQLADLYRGAAARRDVGDVIDMVHGTNAIAQRFAQLQHSAKREVQTLVKADVAVVSRESNDDAETKALERGVRYSVVVERSAFEQPGFYRAAEAALAAGEEVRVATTVPLRILLIDRELALLPLAPDAAGQPVSDALLVHPSGLLDALVSLFEFVWSSAPPLVQSGDGVVEGRTNELEPLDTKVLSLLLAGLTDQAIGSQLGLSLRTVQRRVRQMMDRAQVETRLQLGHEAGRRGWL